MELFLKYFQATAGTLDFKKGSSDNTKPSPIAAVQGYQWHVLNKSENWITRGVRSEYAGSYVIERSGVEIYSGLKQISGAVYMIRRDVLEEVGWETSITEDFQLTLKLYEKGYKVVYTPYIQAPAECVSTLKRLIRQRMRWAEGHSNNIRKMFTRLLIGKWEPVNSEQWSVSSGREDTEHRTPNTEHKVFVPSPLTAPEKLEFLYLSPYYLQAFFFLVGTISWLISETVFPGQLPFWTSLWGWSLVLTNFISLPLMNSVGLFLEESEQRDYQGLISFITLSYLLVPFQAYSSIKGLIQKEEGPWFRTPKTGHITDVFTRGRFYRFISGILPGRAPAVARQGIAILNPKPYTLNPYLALSSANSQFNSFNIKPKRMRWVGKVVLSLMLALTVTVYTSTKGVPEVLATNWTNLYIHNDSTVCTTLASMTTSTGLADATQEISSTNPGPYYWYSDSLPTGTGDASITAGDWSMHTDGTFYTGGGGSKIAFNIILDLVDASDCSSGVISLGSAVSPDINAQSDFPDNSTVSVSAQTITSGTPKRIRLTLSYSSDNKGAYMVVNYNNSTATYDTNLQPSTLTIPENAVAFTLLAPLIPMLAMWVKKRKGGN